MITVLDGADLVVARGELVENGSGKSTLIKILVGLLKRDTDPYIPVWGI